MEFLDMVMELQDANYDKVVLILCGAFYIAIGVDAVLLNNEIGLKLNCAKKNVCKVGIPKNGLYKYLKKIEEKGYSFIVFNYDKSKNELTKRYEKTGTRKKELLFCNDGCKFCENRKKIKPTIYEEALIKYEESEQD